MSKLIAFFDFDGTITHKDTLLEFIRYSKGNLSFYTGFAVNAPALILYKARIISNQAAKETMLRHFFGGMLLSDFEALCDGFAREKLTALIRPKASEEIRKLQSAGAEVVVVSASPEHWLKGWCSSRGITCLATRLEVQHGRLTGRIAGVNCHGTEKVRRIGEQYRLPDYTSIYCYGDTPGDRPMLAIGTHRFYRPFR